MYSLIKSPSLSSTSPHTHTLTLVLCIASADVAHFVKTSHDRKVAQTLKKNQTLRKNQTLKGDSKSADKDSDVPSNINEFDWNGTIPFFSLYPSLKLIFPFYLSYLNFDSRDTKFC